MKEFLGHFSAVGYIGCFLVVSPIPFLLNTVTSFTFEPESLAGALSSVVVGAVTIFCDCKFWGKEFFSRKKREKIAQQEKGVEEQKKVFAESWALWNYAHEGEQQSKRLDRAVWKKFQVKSLNKANGTCTFVGRDEGEYLTNLSTCTCPDFIERGKPCKHMYFLALQLGVHENPYTACDRRTKEDNK